MSQMIITLLAIALASVSIAMSIRYIPADQGRALDLQEAVSRDLARVERAYDVLHYEGGGVVPVVVSSQSDGGFRFYFESKLRFLPGSLGGYSWSYGVSPVQPGSLYSGLGYVCMDGGAGTLSGAWQVALERLKKDYPAGQLVYGGGCGATEDLPDWRQRRPVINFYLVATPVV